VPPGREVVVTVRGAGATGVADASLEAAEDPIAFTAFTVK
jgi:hypothetical protein